MAHESSQSSSSQHLHRHQALGYTNFSSPAADPAMQSFQQSHDQLYGLQTASDAWRAFFPPPSGGGGGCFPPQPLVNENLMCPWQPPNRMLIDESPARFLFPSSAPANGGGLSLSLNHAAAAEASNTGAAAAVSYEPQPHLFHQLVHDHKPADYHQHHDGRGFPQSSVSQPANNPYYCYNHQLKNSKFLLPAMELLNEFCNVDAAADSSKQKGNKNKQWEEGGAPSSSSAALNQSLISSLDIHEIEGRKAKLLAMLEEVDRRYRRYREQMRAVAASFEAAAGEGAAAAYLVVASRVMSRHFRCLREGISGQIHAIRKAAGDRDEVAAAPGTTRGETPRLKVIDQCLRQHRAFQQAGSMESHPWRPQRGLPERSVSILRAWLFEHFLHPYPSDVDKHILARQTGLSRSQVSNWFINARVRLWKPMVEEMYLEETKEHDTSREENDEADNSNVIFDSAEVTMEEQKPPALHDPDSLSWVIMSNPHGRGQPFHGSGGGGAMELDFASYSQQQQWGGGGVSLTLGLQQHDGGGGGGGGGVSLSFSPPASEQQSAASMLLGGAREQMESQFSMLDGEGQINVPYRNLMGAQLLRDLAG